MPRSDFSDTVVVLDLDDTLYPEEAYVRSGISAVCALAAELYGIDHTRELLSLRNEGQRDWLAELCARLPDASATRDCLMWAYRLHRPRISLSSDARTTVDALKDKAQAVVILTDGRSFTQRLKLQALGLDELPSYISDEYGGACKPDPGRFRAVMSDFPAARYLYLADNPAKDFIAPKGLGWLTVGLRARLPTVHPQTGAQTMDHDPHFWIDSLPELLDIERLGPGWVRPKIGAGHPRSSS